MSADPIQWTRGGTATVDAADNVHVTVRSSIPFPPGAPAEGTITHEGATHTFTLKVAGSQKVGERWVVRGRHTGASAAARAAIVAHITPPA